MKKFLALFLALLMMVPVAAFAEAIQSPDSGDIDDPIQSPDSGDVEDEPTVPSKPSSGSSSSASSAAVEEEVVAVKIGQALYAAHGTKCFAVITVAMQGDVIAAAHIEEFQFMDAATAVGVPNSEADFGNSFPEGKVLASKRVNNELYSANMAKSGSTVALVDNYTIIENYVVGMTIAELEAELAGKTAQEMVDAVSGATLVDTLGYLNGILAAAKNAQ